ncbi:MAG TPA: FUSC family protein [Actinomycetota bacterium]|nr:FUSC family protein [Actinomycetota bacterium]
MTKLVRFTREDSIHAALGVIPAFCLIAFGKIAVGSAFAIGLLPTSLMGIAASRRLRLIYGLVGCLFGIGVFLGSLIINRNDTLVAAALFIVIAFVATILAVKRPAGGLLLSLLVPALGVGTGYAVAKAAGLMLAFVAGSIWSCLVMLPWPEFAPDPNLNARLMGLQPRHAKKYGLLLGLTAATAIIVGHQFHVPYPGWIATAALLIIRPLQGMTGWRGVGRAATTIAGTALVIVVIGLELGSWATAVCVSLITIMTIGARSSRLYVTPFGTAFLILTIELYGSTDAAGIRQVGMYRIVNNVYGALIALFYGLLVSWLLERLSASRSGNAAT